jgi:hypothetical protein
VVGAAVVVVEEDEEVVDSTASLATGVEEEGASARLVESALSSSLLPQPTT